MDSGAAIILTEEFPRPILNCIQLAASYFRLRLNRYLRTNFRSGLFRSSMLNRFDEIQNGLTLTVMEFHGDISNGYLHFHLPFCNGIGKEPGDFSPDSLSVYADATRTLSIASMNF